MKTGAHNRRQGDGHDGYDSFAASVDRFWSMTGGASKRVLGLCDSALEMSASEREAFLSRQCEGDPQLRASVESVLLAIDEAGGFLAVEDRDADRLSQTPERIGKYGILEKIGEGGMGTVYLAERRDADFTQRVALKLVRGQFLTPELVRRFQSERRILAALSHPYIAGLIDGGATEQGHPYLVMEYVDGLPLDRYCDEHLLDVRERLELIRTVATAVQYAHQNLVVHRDLKPSNVLVTADGIPKLLDFGIAKLIASDDPVDLDHTALTGHQAMTPEYASPEQILDGKATTASDVFTLGVLTYEILTGERPYRIQASSHRELLKFVEGLSVPRLSTRLKTSVTKDVATKIAARRATTPGRLEKTLKGDLDNILLMALQRQPERRYESVSQFSEDLQRFLDGRPVFAHADSLAYRTQTFLKRNWLAVAAASMIALSLFAGTLAFAWQARVAAQQRDIAVRKSATAEGAVEFLKTTLWSANPWDGSENEATVNDVLTYAETHLDDLEPDDPETKIYLHSAISEIFVGRGEYEKAEEHARAAVAIVEAQGRRDDPAMANTFRSHGFALVDLGDNSAARDTLAHAIGLFEKQEERDWHGLAAALNLAGSVESALGDEASAEAFYRRAIAIHEDPGLDDPSQLLSFYNNLSTALSNQMKTEEAQAALAQATDGAREGDVSDPELAMVLANRAGMLTNLERNNEAVGLYQEAMVLQARSIGAEHPEAIMTATSLGHLFEKMEDFARAEATLRPALRVARESLPDGHFITAYVENVLGLVLCNADKGEEGMQLLGSARATRKAALPEGHWAIASTENAMGSCLTTSGQFIQAETYLLESHAVLRESRGEDHPLTLRSLGRLATLYDAWGFPDKALEYRESGP